MSVKTIFKTLIGTIFIIVMMSVIIEFFNINIYGMMIPQYMQLAADQSCTLFTQETFRTGANGGAISENEIFAADGTTYSGGVGGNFHQFYGNLTSSKDIWESLYKNNSNFKQNFTKTYIPGTVYTECNNLLATYYNSSSTIGSRIPELESLAIMAANNGNVQTVVPPANLWDLSENSMTYIDYVNKTRANTYIQNMYTPVNLGIPYMDQDVVTKMFKWNLTQLLSNCDSDRIQKNDKGQYYVNFNGFAVLTQQARITKLTYHVIDLNTQDTINDYPVGDYKQSTLFKMLNMNPNKLGFKQFNIATSPYHQKISNNLVFIVEVDYEVPMYYIGITPLKNIINFVFDRSEQMVRGWDSEYDSMGTHEYKFDENAEIVDSSANKTSGKLYYTLIR